MEFSNQKVHDILEAINQSLPADIPFISLFDGHAQQNGDINTLLTGLCKVFPEQFHEVSITSLMEQAGLSTDDLPNTMELLEDFKDEQSDSTDPTTDAYWEELPGLQSEFEVFKSQADPFSHDSIDTLQRAISILNTDGAIDGDGNILAKDLQKTLRSEFGLNDITNLADVEWYLEECCGNLISKGYVTATKIGRSKAWNFLESPFTLY